MSPRDFLSETPDGTLRLHLLLPSQAVCRIQLDVLHHASSINGGLTAADSDGAADVHRLAYEQYCRQPSSGVYVRNLEKKVPDGEDVAIVHVADVVLRRVDEQGLFCSLGRLHGPVPLRHANVCPRECGHVPIFGAI